MTKNALKLTGFHVLFFVLTTVVFIVLFHTFVFSNIDVLFYRGIALVVLLSILLAVAVFFIIRKWPQGGLTYRDLILAVVLFSCLNLAFFTLVPVTIERSISIFILGYMAENPGRVFTKDDISEIFVKKYVDEYGAMQKRFDEQIVSGNVQASGDGYIISENGKRAVKGFIWLSKVFGVSDKLVVPK
ncbi:MAG: hypothetical protein WCT02_01115 [Candidatus Paceibacterota bacterium]